MAQTSRDRQLDEWSLTLGMDPQAPVLIGGHYRPVLLDQGWAWVSGQIPRIGTTVHGVGVVGQEIALAEAQHCARISTVRALRLLQQAVGSLDRVAQLLRLTVYVRSAPDFTLHSEVADAASDLLVQLLGEAGVHARTSVGVAQLPKGACVELDLVARVADVADRFA